jgi:hypothetical protein
MKKGKQYLETIPYNSNLEHPEKDIPYNQVGFVFWI